MTHRSSVRADASARRRTALAVLGSAVVLAVASVTVAATPASAAPKAAASSAIVAGTPWVPALWHHAAYHAPFRLEAERFAAGEMAEAPVGLAAGLATRGVLVETVDALQDSPPIDWRVLAGLDYLTGKATDTLKKLEGKRVRVPGFVVPLDDFMEDGAEFLLVPYYGACVHTPPPPPNQIIFVQMANKKAVKLALFDAVWMHGTLKIATVESPYGTVGFTIDGLKMEPYSSR
jgi:hypothetical protein